MVVRLTQTKDKDILTTTARYFYILDCSIGDHRLLQDSNKQKIQTYRRSWSLQGSREKRIIWRQYLSSVRFLRRSFFCSFLFASVTGRRRNRRSIFCSALFLSDIFDRCLSTASRLLCLALRFILPQHRTHAVRTSSSRVAAATTLIRCFHFVHTWVPRRLRWVGASSRQKYVERRQNSLPAIIHLSWFNYPARDEFRHTEISRRRESRQSSLPAIIHLSWFRTGVQKFRDAEISRRQNSLRPIIHLSPNTFLPRPASASCLQRNHACSVNDLRSPNLPTTDTVSITIMTNLLQTDLLWTVMTNSLQTCSVINARSTEVPDYNKS